MQGIQFQENYIQRLPAGLSVEQIGDAANLLI